MSSLLLCSQLITTFQIYRGIVCLTVSLNHADLRQCSRHHQNDDSNDDDDRDRESNANPLYATDKCDRVSTNVTLSRDITLYTCLLGLSFTKIIFCFAFVVRGLAGSWFCSRLVRLRVQERLLSHAIHSLAALQQLSHRIPLLEVRRGLRGVSR